MTNPLVRATSRRLANLWRIRPVRAELDGGLATICFDDFPRSAWTVGGALLEEYGARGTYFVSAAFAPESILRRPAAGSIAGVRYYELDDLVSAHERGHEIGCHSAGHVNVTALDNAELTQSLRSNAGFVRGLIGDVPMTSFAFPQGAVDLRTKRLCGHHFAACRGTFSGMNHGVVDLALLKGIALDARFEHEPNLTQLIARAQNMRAWMVFYGHDVCSRPSVWGSTPRTLELLLAALRCANVEIVTLRAGLARLGAL